MAGDMPLILDAYRHSLQLKQQRLKWTAIALLVGLVLNHLLQPDQQFPEQQKPILNTELRILALIRLGITDTEDIARFLRHSVKTVYNYRTKSRGRTLGNRDEFERLVQTL